MFLVDRAHDMVENQPRRGEEAVRPNHRFSSIIKFDFNQGKFPDNLKRLKQEIRHIQTLKNVDD